MNKFVVLCFIALTLAVAQARLNTNLQKVLARSMVGSGTTSSTLPPYFLVDVGSSGTRLKVAIPGTPGVKDCGVKGNPLAAAAEKGTGVDTIVKGLYDTCTDSSKGEFYLGNIIPELSGKDATTVKNYMKTMKIFYLATAGARQTEDAMVKDGKKPDERLWGEVRKTHNLYTGTTGNSVATTIGGQFEGIFAWRALGLKRSDLSKTVYIEQGGASQQVVFEECGSNFLETESEGPMSVIGVNAYSKSFLGDGLNRLFRAVLKLALEDAVAGDKKSFVHPCLGGKGSIVKAGSAYNMMVNGVAHDLASNADVKDISDLTSLLSQITPATTTNALVTGGYDENKCSALVTRVFAGNDEHFAPLSYATELSLVKSKLDQCTGPKAKTNVVFATNAIAFAHSGSKTGIVTVDWSKVKTDDDDDAKKVFAVLGGLVKSFSKTYLKSLGLESATVETYQCDWVVGFRSFYEELAAAGKAKNLVDVLGYKNNKGLSKDVEDDAVTITKSL